MSKFKYLFTLNIMEIKKKILSVVGTRPEAIKMAPIIKTLEQNDQIISKVVLTGQHRELLDEVFKTFDISSDYDLDVMRPNQSPEQVVAKIVSGLGIILRQEEPQWVLVHGDTTTAMSAAIVAFYRQIRIGHVEAGLRTYDKQDPFPEEANRCIITQLADLHFAPTDLSYENLFNESIAAKKIKITGNPGIDALRWIIERQKGEDLPIQISDDDRIILVTAHRRENFGQGLENICDALISLTERYPSTLQIIWPVHPNPNVSKIVHQRLSEVPQIKLLSPVSYHTLVTLMQRSFLILTDSGGIQEEAPSLGKPVLILRKTTERPEGIDAGVARLVGVDKQIIVQTVVDLWENEQIYTRMAKNANPYGDGYAAERIVEALISYEE